MKPDRKGMVHFWAECKDCDWEANSKNCIGLASQHAKKTGHHVVSETGHSYAWNSPE